jgi:hypothetical protein
VGQSVADGGKCAPADEAAGLPSVLVVHPSLPVRSVAELIAFAKAQPGRIDYAFVPGTVGHARGRVSLFASPASSGPAIRAAGGVPPPRPAVRTSAAANNKPHDPRTAIQLLFGAS